MLLGNRARANDGRVTPASRRWVRLVNRGISSLPRFWRNWGLVTIDSTSAPKCSSAGDDHEAIVGASTESRHGRARKRKVCDGSSPGSRPVGVR